LALDPTNLSTRLLGIILSEAQIKLCFFIHGSWRKASVVATPLYGAAILRGRRPKLNFVLTLGLDTDIFSLLFFYFRVKILNFLSAEYSALK